MQVPTPRIEHPRTRFTASLLADTLCRTVELGVSITDAAVAGEFTHLFCALVSLDPVCAECGVAGRLRDHVERRVTDLPIVGHPTRLRVRVPRFACDNSSCETRIFQQRMPLLAEPRAKTTRRCTRWILQRLAIDRTSVSAVAKSLGLGWDLGEWPGGLDDPRHGLRPVRPPRPRPRTGRG